MKLNKNNYFTIRNTYITNSKITDWFKDVNYFHRKHVLGEIEEKPTDAMLVGKAVDIWLTESEVAFREKFIPVTRRNLSDPPKSHYELPIKQFDMVEKICRKVATQKAYKQLRGFKKQKILQYDIPLGLFTGIAGIPDWFKIAKDKSLATIVDLKTAPTVVPHKYFYHALDYNYFRQQAMYQLLLSYIDGVKEFKSYHLVVAKDPDGIYNVGMFLLNQERIEKQKLIINETIIDIKEEKKFLPQNISFEDAIQLGAMEMSDG